jgi:hypothetical protein
VVGVTFWGIVAASAIGAWLALLVFSVGRRIAAWVAVRGARRLAHQWATRAARAQQARAERRAEAGR